MNKVKKRSIIIIIAALVCSVLLAAFAYRSATANLKSLSATNSTKQTTLPTQVIPTVIPTPIRKPGVKSSGSTTTIPDYTLPLVTNMRSVLGIDVDSDPHNSYPGLPWVRLAYPTCGNGNLSGNLLKSTIRDYHKHGIYVLLITCQASSTGPRLFNMKELNDVAQGGADAVQCGNEEMKYDPNVTHVDPANFAKYYDLCEHAVHAVRSGIPVLLGALDPHVGGVDYSPLVDQVSYLNSVQDTMNTSVHPGGHWSWRSQTMGLIDSWHNGYPSQYVNSLYGLFVFWAQQFNVDLNSGALGKHLWVVEGTGCFKGCGINPDSPYQVAVSHVLTLITDVQTTMHYGVPFFYFSSKDFILSGVNWPMGILDLNGHSKPLRQDLWLGARTLHMSCSNGSANVSDQEQLLAKLYNGCALPGNYITILIN